MPTTGLAKKEHHHMILNVLLLRPFSAVSYKADCTRATLHDLHSQFDGCAAVHTNLDQLSKSC